MGEYAARNLISRFFVTFKAECFFCTVYAAKFGHEVYHMSFEGHKIKKGVPGKVFRLVKEELEVRLEFFILE